MSSLSAAVGRGEQWWSRFFRKFLTFPQNFHIFSDFGPPGPRKSLSPQPSMGHSPLRKPPWEKKFVVVVGPRWAEVSSGGPYNQFWTSIFLRKILTFPQNFHIFTDFGPPGPRKSLSPQPSMTLAPKETALGEKNLSSLSGRGGQK